MTPSRGHFRMARQLNAVKRMRTCSGSGISAIAERGAETGTAVLDSAITYILLDARKHSNKTMSDSFGDGN